MATRNSQTRAKFAYLKYESMLSNLSDETLDPKKKLNAYDINFTPDTKECYIISPDLIPWAINSKVYTFDSIESANEQLNQNTDTYSGQIIAIQYDEKYFGYIVNKNVDGYYVSPLNEYPDEINYDKLGNRPIINLIGTLDEPIMVSDLDTGIYKIKGQYKVSNLEETTYLSASDTLFIVNNQKDTINIKRVTIDDIVDYVITNETIVANKYITEDFLKEKNYVNSDYIDTKIEAVKLLLEDELKKYIVEAINSVMDEALDKKIDERIGEFIHPTEDEQITNLFS